MSRTLRRILIGLASILLVMNLWMWDGRLPFVGYQENNAHMMLLQLIHVVLIVSELLILMLLGKMMARLRFSKVRVISSWLLMVTVGVLAVLLDLFWKKSFQFSSFLDAVMPITRNAMPLATAFVLGGVASRRLINLKSRQRLRLTVAILLVFLTTTIYNRDLWGLDSGNTILSTLLILSLGVLTADWRLQSKRGLLLAAGGLLAATSVMAMIMPKISIMLHNDMSTASRIASLNNFCLIIVALLLNLALSMPGRLADEFEAVVSDRHNEAYWITLGTAAIAQQPLLEQHFIGLAAGHFENLIVKMGLLLATAAIVIIAGVLLRWLGKWLLERTGLMRRLNNWVASLPTSLSQCWPWLKQWWQRNWSTVLLWGSCYVLAIASFLLMNSSWRLEPNADASYNTLLYTLFVCHNMVLLTMLLYVLIAKTMQALFNRYWVALGTTTAVVVIMIVANRIKIAARDEPILPSEVRMVQAYGSLFKMVKGWIWVVAAIVVLLLVIVVVRLEKRYPVAKIKLPAKIGWLVVTVMAFGSSLFWNDQGSAVNAVMTGMGDQAMFYNQLTGARINGPLIQFMNNLDVKVMNEPSGYSKAKMAVIGKRYQKEARRINQTRKNDLAKQNIIFNLSESFSDPRRVPGIKLAHDPMPNIERLKKNNTSGLMISSGYGGGTANMEYMTLTGLALCNFSPTLPTPYTQLVPFQNQAWSINQLFKTSVAIHPYVGVFYSRIAVYQKFGFDRFMYLGSKYSIKHQSKIGRSQYLSDATSYTNTLDQLKRGGNGLFVNLVTMQNHFPYNQHYYDGADYYHASAKNGTSTDQVEQFAMGVHYTDQAVAKFIKQIDRLNKPVTVVFYGDHLPGIYQNDMAKDGLKMHETDYFIYSNRAARKQGAKNLTKSIGYVVPNDFIAMAAEQTNSKVTPYLALLTDVWQKLPAAAMNTSQSTTNTYNSSAQFISQQGKVIAKSKLTKKQRQLWHDYQLVQYDLTTGHQYLLKNGMMK
ncbi:LTA synthase family protein [Limosilactobacillus mucosae]|uniref:LTA synthase family protein n=1 Tax=Limosilactobacillus mucosae TaxID=97478 RepID=UPI0025A49700|nr:LTA synthase family protein [Limosilactobacillus mucosae]MDM8220665.1 LTA synthase family protein [Limosilactobacillus mucosae]MDM8315297.1 LTA synthase family protein [Limosilactobacillus mucosae]